MILSPHEQGTDGWLADRRGVITASRFADALSTVIDVRARQAKVNKKTGEVLEPAVAETRKPSLASLLYAHDIARERVGGKTFGRFQTAQMAYGREQEQMARIAYEVERDVLVEEVGFYYDESRTFGVSVDGLTPDGGAIEIKVLAGSDDLFRVLVDGDHSEFYYQCIAPHWLLGREYTDLCLWTPDLPTKLHVRRICRNADAVSDLSGRMQRFADFVQQEEQRLRDKLTQTGV